MGCEAANFTALGQFLEKLERYNSIVSRRDVDADQVRWSNEEFAWKRVLDFVYAKFRHAHHREDSYRISFSAITEVLVRDQEADNDTLIEACIREHKGQFINRRGHPSYAGEIHDVEAPGPPDDDEAERRQAVAARIEAVLGRMEPRQANLLRRYYLDGPKPTLDELGVELKAKSRPAVKMRLQRAKQKFSKMYLEYKANEDRTASTRLDHAHPDAEDFPDPLGREGVGVRGNRRPLRAS